MQTMTRLFYKLTALFLGGLFLLTTLQVSPKRIAPLDSDTLNMQLALFADVHVEGNNLPRFKLLSTCFKNLQGEKDDTDALILLGDNTMNGQTGEHLLVYGMLERLNPIRPYYTIVGNHDVGNDNEDTAKFEELSARNLTMMQTFIDPALETTYYAKTVNGYRLIFLAPDGPESAGRQFSDAQLDFLQHELEEAAKTDLPVFVFNHYPAYRATSACEERLTELLNSYDKIFLIVGHMHYYTRFTTVDGKMHTPEIWVPCLGRLGDGNSMIEESGLGMRLEVYPDRVVFRGMNYYTNTVTEDEMVYELTQSDTQEEPLLPPLIGG